MRTGWGFKGGVVLVAAMGSVGGIDPATWSLVPAAQAAEANVCTNSMAKNRKRCRIDVKVVDKDATGCTITIPDSEQRELVLKEQSDIRIIWRLNNSDGSYLFCRQTGDGVFLKKPIRQEDGQVLVMRVMKTRDSDDNDTEDEFSCSSRFRWTFKNDVDAGQFPAGTQYDYSITVRNSAFTRSCTFDPFIKNG